MNATNQAPNSAARAKALPALTPARLLDGALAKTESASIRAWAQSQRKEWLKLAALWLRNRAGAGPFANAEGLAEDERFIRFSTYIVITAIGL